MRIGSARLEISDRFSYSRYSDEFYLEVSDTARYPETSYAIVLIVCITISRRVRPMLVFQESVLPNRDITKVRSGHVRSGQVRSDQVRFMSGQG